MLVLSTCIEVAHKWIEDTSLPLPDVQTVEWGRLFHPAILMIPTAFLDKIRFPYLSTCV